ncbi:MAG: taurine catabolism dioxygenase TauD [Rhodospirillaceae bacterium]|nr:taurine catabolism dioxygenase TauD [Rhodospirillaceae bacterium]
MTATAQTRTGKPFDLRDDSAYAAWRAAKLADSPTDAGELRVVIADASNPSAAEIGKIRDYCRRFNMAVYQVSNDLIKDDVLALAAHFGLNRLEKPLLTGEDGITELSVAGMADSRRGVYIPYSNKQLSWHTDGYYNPTGQWVLGMLLHCVRPAKTGGESQLFDSDIAYIRLRDENPAWISALMHADTLTIPANDIEAGDVRGAEAGPVFALIDGQLAMRYTHRVRSAVWRDDPLTAEARAFLRDLLDDGDPLMVTHRLQAGEGVICNNVLHRRTSFENPDQTGQGRLLYRARFRDRVAP